MSTFDVAFVGSSPNALIAAARLSRSGAKVVVLETRPTVGGPAVTEAFAPGFLADRGLQSLAIEPEILAALGVDVAVIRRPATTLLGAKPVTITETPALPKAFGDAVEVLRAIHRLAPPRVPAGSAGDAAALGDLGTRLVVLGARSMHEVLRLSFLSVRDFVKESVASEAEGTLLAVAALRNLAEGPFAPGTLYPLLHRFAIGDGLFQTTAKGGLGALANALAAAARSAGAELRVGAAGPLKLELANGVAAGVRLGDGTVVAAKHVVSDLDARATFTSLVAPRDLEPEENRAIRRIRYRGVTARVHLALSSLPSFAGPIDGSFVIADGVAGIERAWDAGKRGQLSPHPVVELAIPSVLDPGLAPEGQHVLDASVRYAPYGRVDREQVIASLLAALERFDAGIRGKVLHADASTPDDLERRFGLSEGHLEGGEIRLDQAFFLRPYPGYSAYGSPIENLWLGGSAAHPGGHGGQAGENLAKLLAARIC